jgi:predicted anti-sigma-YlaC factor YlaD
MLRSVPSGDCDRARRAASAAVDGELSELETVFLDAHLGECAECEAFAAELGSLTSVLRASAPEPLPHALVLHRPPRRARSLSLAVAVGAAALTGALGFVFGEALSPAGGGSAGSSAAISLPQASSVSLAARLFAFGPVRRASRSMARPGTNIAV